jgi:dUTP pyrophosphatase
LKEKESKRRYFFLKEKVSKKNFKLAASGLQLQALRGNERKLLIEKREEMRMDLKIKALSPKIGTEIPTPFYASAGAAAMDLHACIDAPVVIPAGKRVVIPTGLAIGLPSADYVALVFARSGLGIKHGIAPANCVGVIDSDYRGELMVGLQNSGDADYTVQPGDRIAQLMIVPVVQAHIQLVDELDDTQRGAGGFGSTGK